MRRYEGLLRPLISPAPWPARWIVVDTVGKPISVVDRKGIRQTGLESWHAIIMSMRGAKCLCREEAAGAEAASLWTLLVATTGRAGPTWVISPRALYSWTLLGLFERLLTGSLAVANQSPVRPRRKPDRGLGREPGLFMAADPPSAVMLDLEGSEKPLTWVCASNYGWAGLCLDVAGLEACRRLARTIEESSLLLDEHRLGGWAVTVGAMAMRAWRSQHMKGPLYVSNRSEYLSLCSRGAFGGRCQALQTHGVRHRCYRLDARGLYCQLGIDAALPSGFRTHSKRGDSAKIAGRSDESGYLAAVTIRHNGGRFPCREGREVTYPLGDIQTVLCGPELVQAIKGGYVSEIGECLEFKLGSPIADYEGATKAMRRAAQQSGCTGAASLSKSLAVSLIGKLAAHEETWEEARPDYNDPISGSWYGPDGKGGLTEWTALGGTVSRRIRRGLAWYAIPEIPLWLWSLGRAWLWERMNHAGPENCLYVDTDGLIVLEAGYRRLQNLGLLGEGEWGQLRLINGPTDVEVIGPKVVRIGEEIIYAGAPKNQRGTDFAEKGYWYRSPLGHEGGAENQGFFEEQFRERKSISG